MLADSLMAKIINSWGHTMDGNLLNSPTLVMSLNIQLLGHHQFVRVMLVQGANQVRGPTCVHTMQIKNEQWRASPCVGALFLAKVPVPEMDKYMGKGIRGAHMWAG